MSCLNYNKFRVIKGDITQVEADAIVNGANTFFLGGGGVDSTIHRAADQKLKDKYRELNDCKIGEAKIAKGYNLKAKKAKYIIHTVGPVWRHRAPYEDDLLRNCYRSCFQLAKENDIKTIAFPCISTGVYRFPNDRAAKIAINTCKELMRKVDVREVIFVCYKYLDYHIYQRKLRLSSLKTI